MIHLSRYWGAMKTMVDREIWRKIVTEKVSNMMEIHMAMVRNMPTKVQRRARIINKESGKHKGRQRLALT